MDKPKGSVKKYLAFVMIYFFNLLPVKKNKIIFFSYYGSQYGCNPKYITEYILKNYPGNTFDIVWAYTDPSSKPDRKGIRKVRTMSIKYFYELCTSKVIITNFRTTELFVKRKNQYYIQTWHSSLRLKQIEKDAEESLPLHYVQNAIKDSGKCDLLLSGCDYSTQTFKRAFWYEGEIFECGTPRNDVLFHTDPEMKTRIFQQLNIPKESRIILYAPTFRKNHNLDVYNLDFQSILEKLKNQIGGKWVILVKLHPHLILKSNQLAVGPNVMDVTSYDDTQELLSIADILISDYSSLMFDFSITLRPCFLFIPDLMDYMKNERDLYFDIKELPFISAFSNKDLIEKIENFDKEKYKKDLNEFLLTVGSYEDGKASEKLLHKIYEVAFSRKRRKVYAREAL
ncbi:CDP-glycerol glycerophosphotransferase family protein [Heyndrickxia sp. NPDC080065]|uniref:CDP-glycerol glycerophosphotransferase family protein n=1 Tax=Heyndrickxia sp. NPDC080065 TaxID=3390568 RepID=UPI003D05787F